MATDPNVRLIDEIVVKVNNEIITRKEAGTGDLRDKTDQLLLIQKGEVMDKLYTPRRDPALRTYLTKLREDAFLEIKAGYVDSGAAPGKDTSWKDPATLKPESTTKEEVAARRRKRKLLGVWVRSQE